VALSTVSLAKLVSSYPPQAGRAPSRDFRINTDTNADGMAIGRRTGPYNRCQTFKLLELATVRRRKDIP
jgi:hypothetical protein